MVVVKTRIDNCLSKLLDGISMNQKSAGYEEIRIGMKLVFEDGYQFKKEKDLYKEIAKIIGKKEHCIEKNIREAIGTAFAKSKHSEEYNLYTDINDCYTGKPKAKKFILRTIEILREWIEREE